MNLSFLPFPEEQIPLFLQWARLPHVATTWFREGYMPPETIREWVAGNGYDEPYLIEVDGRPVGFILACDLAGCRDDGIDLGLYREMEGGTFSIDLFLAEQMPPGTGTIVVREFCRQLFLRTEVERIVLDPAVENKRAIRCYEKVGFRPLFTERDRVCECQVMQLRRGEELRLIVVRHAEAEHNVQRRFNSTDRPPSYLTTEGRQAAKRVANQLADSGFSLLNVEAIYHSPMVRTQETAQILMKEGVCARLVCDERLREVDAGRHEGELIPTSGEIEGGWAGESVESVYERVASWGAELRQRRPTGHVVVVTHGTPATQLLKWASADEVKFCPGEARNSSFMYPGAKPGGQR